MSKFLSIQDFPRLGDEHFSTRDMDILIHTHAELRRYRDYLAVMIGPASTYEHLTYVLYRSLKDYFHETFAEPFFRLKREIEGLTIHALMAAGYVAVAETLKATDKLREQEDNLLRDITGGVGAPMRQDVFPDHLDALGRVRRLYAMRASLIAQDILPAVPEAAEILAREFSGEAALPRFPSKLTPEQKLMIRTFAERYPDKDFSPELDPYLPPDPPQWDYEAATDEICQAVIRTYLAQLEDDAFMDAWIQQIRPQLNEHGEPSDKNIRRIEAFLADTERCSYQRFPGPLYPSMLDWIAAAEACGHPFHPGVLTMAGYQPPRDDGEPSSDT